MQYDADRDEDGAGDPSLAEMTELAIEILSRDEDGFFLMVEGGRIDHAREQSIQGDTLAFDDAIERALSRVNLSS